MSYKYQYRQTSNSSPRRNFGYSRNPVGITIHHWGSDGQSHSAVVNWLAGVGNRATSAHYVVSSGLVTQLETDYRATWHAGNGKGNGTTIGIEMRPEMSDGDWATLVDLCVTIEKEHGSMKYYRHRDWKATACPGRYSGMIAKLVNDVNAALKGGTTKPSAPKPSAPSKPSSPSYRVKRTNTSGVEVKAGSYRTSDTIDTLSNAGYNVNVVQTKGSWTQVRNSKGSNGNGWVPTASLNPFFEDQRGSNGIATVELVSRTNQPNVPVYAGTGSNAEQIDTLHKTGYRVNVTGYKGNTASWTRVRNSKGAGGNGWIKTAHLEQV